MHSIILMSGTLKPVPAYSKLFGLNTENTLVKALDPVFEPKNRPVYIQDKNTTLYSERNDKTWENYADDIISVANNVLSDELICTIIKPN